MSDQLAELLRKQLKEGTWDSSGAFTLDLARAASRLGQDFAAAHPGCYPLRLVQAGVAMECDEIHFRTRGKTISLRFQNPRVKHLSEYFEFALQRSNKLNDSTPFFPLFQGLWAALREDGNSVTVAVQEHGKRVSYTCSSESVERLREEKTDEKAPNDLELELLLDRNIPKSLRSLIQARCSFCPVPLFWNGRRVGSRVWARLSPQRTSDWYLPWAPHGFRLAEAYITKARLPIKSSITVPLCSKRRPAFSGVGNPGQLPRGWRARATNTLFHKGNGEGRVCGAVAQSLVKESTTDLLLVSLGVTLESSAMLIREGGMAVLECSSAGVRTDIFGLKAVADRNLAAAQAMVQERLKHLRGEVRPYLLELPRRAGIRDLQIWSGAAIMVFGSPLAGPLLGLGLGGLQVGLGLFQKRLDNSSFLAALGVEFPELARNPLPHSRRGATRSKL